MIENLQSVVIGLTGLVVALSALVPVVIRLWQKVSRVVRMSEEMYESHLLRGKIEVLQKGLGEEFFDTSPSESPEGEATFMPLAIRKKAHALYSPIAPQLRGIRERNPEATEGEIGRFIERRFGKWLARNICVPLGVWQYACIAMAISVADGIPPIDDSVHD